MAKITMKGSKLTVDGVEFDLSKYSGKKVTVFKDPDDSLTIESKPIHQTAICELEVPEPVVNAEETGELDAMDMPVTREVITPIDLSKVEVHTFEGGE
jgi:hypothetical protein